MQLQSMDLGELSGHIAGRRLLAQMYTRRTGKAIPPILLTDMGKPYFARGDLQFSISHTPRRVFCALADGPVGIDAEELDRQIDLRLADKLLSSGERAQYDTAPDKRVALLRFWVLKEALAKLEGRGLRLYPNHTNFSLDDPRVQILDGCLVAVLTGDA